MALHPNFTESPYAILDPALRWWLRLTRKAICLACIQFNNVCSLTIRSRPTALAGRGLNSNVKSWRKSFWVALPMSLTGLLMRP